MATCVFMKWIPASWKSTYCREQLPNHKRFNRDDFRKENPTLKEDEVHKAEEQFIRDNVGIDIVIDNTHLSSSLDKKIEFAKWLWYETKIIDMCHYHSGRTVCYLEWSINNNNHREEWRVPNSVIYEMYLSYLHAEFLKSNAKWFKHQRAFRKHVIVDIDWTIADLEHRKHHIMKKPKDHDSFYSEVLNDKPIQDIIDLVNVLSEKYSIILVSWRRNQTCEDTEKRLYAYWVKYNYLLMRQWRDHRPDTEVKNDIYEKCLKSLNIVFAIDDRKCIVDLWKSKWIKVLDCLWWDF